MYKKSKKKFRFSVITFFSLMVILAPLSFHLPDIYLNSSKAQTEINQDTTWTVENSPYLIEIQNLNIGKFNESGAIQTLFSLKVYTQ